MSKEIEKIDIKIEDVLQGKRYDIEIANKINELVTKINEIDEKMR